MTTEQQLRLNTFLALHKRLSRREADNLIQSGEVTINGKLATLGARIYPTDVILVSSQPLQADTKLQTILFHKPIGCVCSRKQQGETPTIYSILPAEYHSLKPIGRLDKESSGIILLSNDGNLAYRMTHPKFHKPKTYLVTLDKDLEPFHHQAISHYGVALEDGVSKLELTRLNDSNNKEWQVTMFEGRNRQIRRTFKSLGYDVIKLHRTTFGNYSLGDIKPGKWIELDISQ